MTSYVIHGTMIAATAALLLPFAEARALGPRIGRVMLGVSAAALAAFGAYQIWAGGAALAGRLAQPLTLGRDAARGIDDRSAP